LARSSGSETWPKQPTGELVHEHTVKGYQRTERSHCQSVQCLRERVEELELAHLIVYHQVCQLVRLMPVTNEARCIFHPWLCETCSYPTTIL